MGQRLEERLADQLGYEADPGQADRWFRAIEVDLRKSAVSERELNQIRAMIRSAMRHYFMDTHNVAEGAGAAPLAALMRERARMAGKRVGLVLSGGNVDLPVFRAALAAEGPSDI